MAMIVICGFAPRLEGIVLPSATKRPATSWASPSGPTHERAGSVPMRHVPSGWNAVTSKSPRARRMRRSAGEPVLLVLTSSWPTTIGRTRRRAGARGRRRRGSRSPRCMRARSLAVHVVEDERRAAGAGAHLAAALVLDHEAEGREVRVALHELHEASADHGHRRPRRRRAASRRPRT